MHQEAWFLPCFVRKNQQKKTFFLLGNFRPVPYKNLVVRSFIRNCYSPTSRSSVHVDIPGPAGFFPSVGLLDSSLSRHGLYGRPHGLRVPKELHRLHWLQVLRVVTVTVTVTVTVIPGLARTRRGCRWAGAQTQSSVAGRCLRQTGCRTGHEGEGESYC